MCKSSSDLPAQMCELIHVILFRACRGAPLHAAILVYKYLPYDNKVQFDDFFWYIRMVAKQ